MGDVQFLYRSIVFQTPERTVHPPSWLAHTPFAFWIIDALRPEVFVELGVHSGNSYSSFAQAVQTLGLSTACYAVDTWRGDPHAGAFDEDVFEEWAAYHDRRFSAFSRLIRADFDEALAHFSDGTIDLLHIDGYHTFDAVAHDFAAWRPKMSDRGVVLCHDINVRDKDFGAWQVWERLTREFPSFEFRHGHGLGVLAVGSEMPEPLKWLVSVDSDVANTVRLFFARLGSAVLNQYAADDAQRIAADAQRALEDAQRAAGEAQRAAGDAQSALDDAERAADAAQSELRRELSRRDDRLVEASARIESLTRESGELREALQLAESRIESLTNENAESREALRLAEPRVQSLTTENAELRGALQRAEQALAAREDELAEVAARAHVQEAERKHPTIVVVSHVGCWRPRAGNEYHLSRMFRWYQRRGYRLIPVIAPLPGQELSREAMEGTAATFGNVIQVHRDGRIEHDLRDVPSSLLPFPASLPPVATPVDEHDAGSPRRRELIKIDRTFCHDAVISTVLHLQESLGPHILQVEYIWMTRLLSLVPGNVLKVVDTHDVFSSIDGKVSRFGVRDVAITAPEEAERLRRADLILAIQREEEQELERLARPVPVITASVDFDVVPDGDGAIEGRILYVASDNPRNRKGLEDFLRLAWPRIRGQLPHARFVVVGSVAKGLAGHEVPGVTVVGPADDVTREYRQSALVINPVVAGTGVKIKTLEALCHLRPIVTWPAGVDGVDPSLAARCAVARDWYEFSNLVIHACAAPARSRFTAADRDLIAARLSPETIYAALDAAYTRYFERHGVHPAPVALVNPISTKPAVLYAD
jgi:hypothetical protein